MSNQGAAGAAGRRALLVEDTRSHADLIGRSFDNDDSGWILESVGTLKLARDSISSAAPDVVIADLVLPDGRGTDLIHPTDAGECFPVVIVTGHGDETAAVEAMRAGAYDYVVKSAESLETVPRVALRAVREWELNQAREFAERALRRSEERYRRLVDDMPLVICRHLPDGTITFASRGLNEFTGTPAGHIIGESFFDLLRENECMEYSETLVGLCPEDPVHAVEYEISVSGQVRWHRWIIRALFNSEGELAEYQSVGEDVTVRKNHERDLQRQATVDFLTGLPNRLKFEDRLDVALSQAKRYAHLVALLFLDLDEFKEINDSLGHQAGDAVLKEVAARLGNTLREIDTVARLGGDEFTVLIEKPASLQDVAQVLERIISTVGMPFNIDGHEVTVSVSIGVGVYPHDAEEPAGLVQQADRALYLAKHRGKNQYQFPSMTEG